jgi:hypothetical protein
MSTSKERADKNDSPETASHDGGSTAPETLQITLTAQQHRDFTICAETCGLDLVAWIVQCATVHATAAIDALQALQRKHPPAHGNTRRHARMTQTSSKSTTLEASRSYNTKFRSRSRNP